MALLAVLLAACCAVVGLAGCRDTDALTEVFYTQDAETVDHDNPDKIYVPVKGAAERRNDVVALQREDEGDDEQREQSLPEELQAARSSDLPRPEVVAGQSVDSRSAGNAARPDVEQASPVGDDAAGQAAGSAQTSADGAGQAADPAGNAPSSAGGDERGRDAAGKDASHDDASRNGGGAGGAGRVYDGRNGTAVELPRARTVAAAGDLAPVAATLGGIQALAGAPERFADSEGTRQLFGNAPTAFSGDGMASDSADLAALVELAPDAVVVPDGCEALSDQDVEALLAEGIDVAFLPSMRSAGGIRMCVEQMGRILIGPAGPSGLSPQAAADAYLKFYDRVMSEALASHGGTFAGATFDVNTPGAVGGGVVSLFVDGWDGDAGVTVSSYPAGGVLVEDAGVAYCTWERASGPVSTFMSAGGAANNLRCWAARTWLSKSTLPLLPYNENFVSYRWTGANIPLSGGTGITGGAFRVLSNAADGTACLGQPGFPALIARTPEIASSLAGAAARPGGLYTPGEQLEQGVGRLSDGEFLPMYTLAGYGIYVNPAGHLGSWADGGMEGVLESAWVASKFSGYPESKVRDLIGEYYRTFYGRALDEGEIDDILSGVRA